MALGEPEHSRPDGGNPLRGLRFSAMNAPPLARPIPAPSAGSTARLDGALSGLLLTAWLVVLIALTPLFVSLPLTSDVVLYDLQARCVLDGGVAYRDVFETNLPGMIWVHMLLRPIIGPSSEAIRIADLTVVGGIIAFFWFTLARIGVSRTGRLATGLAMSVCYLSTNEWCHCQRDTWMLLPCLAAVGLRMQVTVDGAGSCRRSFVEGCLWACAFWIKPFVAVPAVVCLVVSWLVRRPRWSTVAADAAAVIAGGLAAGATGVLWLVHSGAWPFFLEQMMEWNPEYFAAGKERWTVDRLQAMAARLLPWIGVHALAVPLAIGMICSAVRSPSRADNKRRAMVSALYCGWLAQSLVLQHLMDYIHIPAILLGIVVLACHEWTLPAWGMRVAAATGLAAAVFLSPPLAPARLATWSQCVQFGSTPAVRSALTDVRFPSYTDIDRVVSFLREQNVRDGEVTCYNVHSIHIYDQLGLAPSTRYLSLASLLGLFPEHRAEMERDLRRSRQRFVVTELLESLQNPDEAASPSVQPQFPWGLPVVFRSGNYLVHAVPATFGSVTGSLAWDTYEQLR